jgi:hypothetical protein
MMGWTDEVDKVFIGSRRLTLWIVCELAWIQTVSQESGALISGSVKRTPTWLPVQSGISITVQLQ